MGGLACGNVNEMIFFTYIGFSIAAFAFLCSYLMFPKALLADLSNFKLPINSPCVTDWNCVALDNNNVIDIISFFHEIDTITFTILTYIIFSILGVIGCILVYYKLLSESAAKIYVSICSFIYIVVIFNLIQKDILNKKKKRGEYDVKNRGVIERKDFWNKRRCYVKIERWYLLILFFGIFISLWILDNGILLFLFFIIYLILLFITYLLPIAKRKPVSKMLELWMKDAEIILAAKEVNKDC